MCLSVCVRCWGPVEVVALDFLEMEGHGYDRFGEGDRDTYQIDYRRIVGDMEPARPRILNRDGERPLPYGAYVSPSPHGHGHETAAQRYSVTRIQAGYEPERSVCHHMAHTIRSEIFSLSSSTGCVLLKACLSASWAENQILLPALPSQVYRKSIHRQEQIPFVTVLGHQSNICNSLQPVFKKQR